MKRAAALVASTLLALAAASPTAVAAEVDAQDVLILRQTVDSQQEAIDGLRRRLALVESQLAESRRDADALKRSSAAMAKDFATQEQLKALAGKLELIDRNRADDSKKIYETLRKFADAPPIPAPAPITPTPRIERSDHTERTVIPALPPATGDRLPGAVPTAPAKPAVVLPDLNYEHIVQANQTLSEILVSYRKEYGLKTTMAHIEAANPGLNAKKLKVGQKVLIPAVK